MSGALRIVCLLPAATEIVAAVGLADRIVGISHECDRPVSIRNRAVLTSSSIDSSKPSAEIDNTVRERARQALTLYDLDLEALAGRVALPEARLLTPNEVEGSTERGGSPLPKWGRSC